MGFALIAAVVAMHNLTASTLPVRLAAGAHHSVVASESSDDAHCSHQSHGSDDCGSIGVHACEAILLDSDSGTAASPLSGWVEPTEADRAIRLGDRYVVSLRGPPPRTALSLAELSIWRL